MAHVRRFALTVVTAVIAALALHTATAAAAGAQSRGTSAVAKAYCTAAQVRAKRTGRRVACAVRPKACFTRVRGKRVRVNCRTQRRVVTPRLSPTAPAVRPQAQLMALNTWIDEGGVDDESNHLDLTQATSDRAASSTTLSVNWDVTSRSGTNSADACFLFDTNGNRNVDVSICVSWQGNGVLQSVTRYTCDDSSADRCLPGGSTSALPAPSCVMSLAPDPFAAASSDAPTNDRRATCTFTDVQINGGADSTLLNTCSVPSGQPNAAPRDCVLIPRDGSLEVAKALVGGPAGWVGPFDIVYVCTDAGRPSISGSASVVAGTSIAFGVPAGYRCSASEVLPTAPTGYAWSTSSPNITGAVTIRRGETRTVTVTNTLEALPATLIVRKVLVNNSGGTRPATDFTFRINGGTPIPFEDDRRNVIRVPAGLYDVVEDPAPGYATTYSNCTGLQLPPGGSATCVITNDDIPALLTIRKVLIADNGSQATPADFRYSINGARAVAFPEDAETTVTVDAGVYTVTEPPSDGYTISYANCTDVAIPNGGTATCVITNDDKPGTLIVNKVVQNDNGGTATADDFSFSVNAGPPIDFEADGSNSVSVDAGTYSVTETPADGYRAALRDCEGVQIGNGQTATCTITNRDRPVTLVVTKEVINDHGGTATAADFSFSVNGQAPIAFDADGSVTIENLPAGDISVQEVASAGYSASYSRGCATVGAPNGDTVRCTITNDDVPATLVVQKNLITDNGSTARLNDFSFTVTGGAEPITRTFRSGGVATELPAGQYNVTEGLTPEQAQQFATSYSGCSDIELTNGAQATCVITNDDRPGTLVVRKRVVNDNGGSATAGDFSFIIDDGAPIRFESDGENTISVDAGRYTITEADAAGYNATAQGCTRVRIENGGQALCEITNDDEPVTLIVHKRVINDQGGTKTAGQFSFQINGAGPATPFTEVDGDPSRGRNRITGLSAGDITVTEVEDPAYRTTYSDGCSASAVTVGATISCVITNDDRPARLIVRKIVVNDTGGTKAAGDFSFEVNGQDRQPFTEDPDDPSRGRVVLEVLPGQYTVTEVVDPLYSANMSGCRDIVVSNGDDAVCTVTNNDVEGRLVITKVVLNNDGGTLGPTDFSYSINGSEPIGFQPGETLASGTSGVVSLAPGTYSVTEPATAGYRATNACARVVVTVGQRTECTIVNDDIPPRLTLVKSVRNGQTGSATAGAFTLTASAAGSANASRNIQRAGDITTPTSVFAAVTYNLGEAGPEGYEPSGPYACRNTDPTVASAGFTQQGNTVRLMLGADVTCTITNLFRDVAIAKRAVGGPFAPGGTIPYQVVVTNTGAVTIPFAEISVTDSMFPDGLTPPDDDADLGPGQSLVYTASRSVTTADCGVVTNTATVTVPRDGLSGNNSAAVQTEVVCTRDLVLTKTSDKAVYAPGEDIVYTLVVRNAGTLPVATDAFTVDDPDLGSLTRQPEVPEVLNPGDTVVFTGSRRATSALCGQLVNTATVSMEGEATPQNNVASRTVRVAGGSCVQGPRPTRLAIGKSGPGSAAHGKNVVYRIVVQNRGSVPSFNTVVTDPLPRGLALRGVPRGATLRAGRVSWHLGTLQPGAQRTLRVVVRSTGSVTLRRCNVAFVRADNAARVADRACTRFVRVAGASAPGVTG